MDIPRYHELATRIRQGEVLLGTFLNLGSPIATEICGSAGFDWVVIDLEHGSGTEANLIAQLQAAAATTTYALVRVESHDRSRIGHALDAGAEGIVVPRVENAEQAQMIVAATRYPPSGNRGVALMNRAAAFGMAGALALLEAEGIGVTVLQIESRLGLDAADEIAAVDGVDVIFLGPADLSQALGVFGRFTEPIFVEALRHLVRAASNHGKVAGVLAGDIEEAERYLDAGYRFIGVGGDSGFLARAARSTATGLRERVIGRLNRNQLAQEA